MRASVRREVEVAVDADRAWEVVGAADVLHLWFPGIVDCTVEGTTRTITTGTRTTAVTFSSLPEGTTSAASSTASRTSPPSRGAGGSPKRPPPPRRFRTKISLI